MIINTTLTMVIILGFACFTLGINVGLLVVAFINRKKTK